ncbi:hypothetical protein [Winogradskyella sp.]|uniref:hypothetical protein n=1 Tax=Winogradskyella sp. TaxID=1883156 RepID=UPI0025F94A3A|nr:hypothetical protein [Winogradskyella sp.]
MVSFTIHANNDSICIECESHPDAWFCDLCACTTSSGSLGFGTLNNVNFIGLRYIYQTFESRNGIFENSPRSKEIFNTYQLWAQVPVYKSIYITATVPYQDLNRRFEGETEGLSGLGDVSAIGWYKLQFYKKESSKEDALVDFNKTKEPSGHSIQFGLGIKLPTGEFEEAFANNVNPGFQVGTGSVDGIFSLRYDYSGNRFGINTLLSYYLKGENKNEYQFGNQMSYALNFYSVFKQEKMNIIPFIGVSGDLYEPIRQFGEVLKDTDGDITNASVGLEVAIKNFVFGANYTLPIRQNLFGNAVEAQSRTSLYVNYVL